MVWKGSSSAKLATAERCPLCACTSPRAGIPQSAPIGLPVIVVISCLVLTACRQKPPDRYQPNSVISRDRWKGRLGAVCGLSGCGDRGATFGHSCQRDADLKRCSKFLVRRGYRFCVPISNTFIELLYRGTPVARRRPPFHQSPQSEFSYRRSCLNSAAQIG